PRPAKASAAGAGWRPGAGAGSPRRPPAPPATPRSGSSRPGASDLPRPTIRRGAADRSPARRGNPAAAPAPARPRSRADRLRDPGGGARDQIADVTARAAEQLRDLVVG